MRHAHAPHGRSWHYLVVLTGLLPGTIAFADDSVALRQGAEILQPFKQELQQALKSGLAEGPTAAIDACRLQAPAIAAGLSTDNVRVGRSSHKLRNPANAPEPWVRLIMMAYLEQPDEREPVAVRLESGRIGYVEPIILQPMCTTCHGESLSEPVATANCGALPGRCRHGFQGRRSARCVLGGICPGRGALNLQPLSCSAKPADIKLDGFGAC